MPDVAPTTRTAFRTCPLCEASCGLEITLRSDGAGGEEVQQIRGDRLDVFSKGYLCPKGSTLTQLHEDPDRLRSPMVKRNGVHVPVSWDEAWRVIDDGLGGVIAAHGRGALAAYVGNPTAHSLSAMTFSRVLLTGLGTRHRFSASTVDQMPRHVASGHVFGSPVAIPVPDLDRTDYLMILGANPYASNGSVCTAPDFPGRLERIRERGGRVIVVDPRRSETAERADLHLPIRPGTDGHLLAAVARTLLTGGLATPGRLRDHTNGLDELTDALAAFDAERVAPVCGVDPDAIRELARELAASPTAAVYGRIGTCTQEFGTLASWLVDVVNLLTGNLDRIGGAMFATGAAGQPSTKGRPGSGRGMRFGRAHSRVGSRPESLGEFPVSAFAEEIETPGEGQVRAVVTVGGNPVSSNPNSERLDAALASLDFMVSIDPYVNETTRHADVILPPPTPLQKSHYDLALLNFGVRNVANYSPAVLPLAEGQLSEGEIMLRLAGLLGGDGPDADVSALDDQIARSIATAAVRDEHGPVHDREPDELLELTAERSGPERILDIMLRTGPFGDGFGDEPDGLSLAQLEAAPHGLDLGPLQPDRIPDLLRTPSGRIEAFPDALRADIDRLRASLARDWTTSMVLVGRRHVRSNNSWMHNVRTLTTGRNRCTMQIHPDDAERLGLADGAPASVTSRVGQLAIDVEITDGIRPGVVSIPHGFGQNLPGVRLRVAREYRGVNTNVLTDDEFYDPISGNVALNGVPVTVAALG